MSRGSAQGLKAVGALWFAFPGSAQCRNAKAFRHEWYESTAREQMVMRVERIGIAQALTLPGTYCIMLDIYLV